MTWLIITHKDLFFLQLRDCEVGVRKKGYHRARTEKHSTLIIKMGGENENKGLTVETFLPPLSPQLKASSFQKKNTAIKTR